MKRSIWTEDYELLRKQLKEIRKKQNLKQQELADILNKPRTYVTKYENADRNLDFIEVVNVCLACDVNPLKFLKRFLKAK